MELPKGKKALLNKSVFRIKHEDTSLSPRYKAILVLKRFSQKKEIGYDEIISPLMKISSIRVVLGLTVIFDLEVEE